MKIEDYVGKCYYGKTYNNYGDYYSRVVDVFMNIGPNFVVETFFVGRHFELYEDEIELDKFLKEIKNDDVVEVTEEEYKKQMIKVKLKRG